MRTSLCVLVVALAGCGEQKAAQDNGGWVATSAALQAHGVYAVRVAAADAADPGVQVVALRGEAQESIGKLSLRQGGQGGSVTLEFRGDTWAQSFDGGAQGTMVMTLDGSVGTFVFDGSAWQGDANAQSVMARSASLIELSKLIGAEVGLTLAAPAPSTTTTTTTPAPVSTPEPTPAGPALNCTDAVVYAQGQALFFEPDGQACKNAQLALALECKALTTTITTPNGLACCNVPSNPTCFNCVDVGFFKQCSVYGYLQQVN